jgi:hypothetical protein
MNAKGRVRRCVGGWLMKTDSEQGERAQKKKGK